ncbi:outer membrane beta-barrel protein [Aquimarina gracilis]|uniref:Outer membrane beta-barrel protein n=1 Tax=Aquimarina gracilis TaxID=874422 RepID=A0ABU5ZTJ7_9FLAO|nr:outer membrane beta-barrel protein [Aquimarina gracilis]MEB3344958.1 outer membrane beta-barrel protein [Aquimarina gracilis]
MNKILKVIVLSLCLTLSYVTSTAQSIETISGNVVNSKSEVLLGNAILLSSKDSTVITGTSFFAGKFDLVNLNEKKAILKLTSLEFQDKFIDIEYIDNSNIDLGNIVVTEAQYELEEVAIVSKSSLVKEKPDGSVEVKVANTTLATSTSVNEILSKSPSIVVNEDNEIGVFGKGNAIIFINGIRVANERLSTLSPSNIEKIEIIGNPGPRYDAEGNAVINIITKRNIDEGSKGAIKNYYSYTDFAGYQNRTNIDYNYAKGKWSFNSNYGLIVGKDRQILETTRSRNEVGDVFNSDIETDWQYDYENLSNYGLGIQYNFSNESYISVQYTGGYEELGGGLTSDNTITDVEVGIYTSDLLQDDVTLKNTINANYYSKIDTLGSNLFIGSQYASYNNDFDNNINESNIISGIENNARINNVGENNIDIFSAQLDYTKMFKNDYALEMGIKYGYVNINSNTTFFDIDNEGNLILDEQLSSNFDYDERVPAGYINFKGTIKKGMNYSLGMRTEFTDYTLFSSVDGGVIVEDDYINFFPNASFSAKLSDKASTYLTYSSRIKRPPYNRLNPFVVYQDVFTSIRGNPDLQPSIVHAIELGGTYKKWSLKLGYNYTKDPIYGGAFQSQENPSEYILQRANLSREHSYFASLSKNINLKWWRSINTASISINDLIEDEGVFQVSGDIEPYFYLYSQNSFDVKDWFTIYLTAWYLGDKRDGIYLRKDQSSVNMGLEKKLFNNTVTCNIDFNDIFNEYRADGEYRVGITDVTYANTYNANYFRFSVSYNFGNLKKSKYKNKDVGKSETRRAQ